MNTYCKTCGAFDSKISNSDNACCNECGDTEGLVTLLDSKDLDFEDCEHIAHVKILSIKKRSSWRIYKDYLINQEVILHYQHSGKRSPWHTGAIYKDENPDLKRIFVDAYISGLKFKIIKKLN